MPVPSRGSDQYLLRLPDGMRARIAERAKDNMRSMNSEIIVILTTALGDESENKSASEGVAPPPEASPET